MINDTPAANPSNPSIQLIALITPVIQSNVKINLLIQGELLFDFQKIRKKGNNWKLSILKPLAQSIPDIIN